MNTYIETERTNALAYATRAREPYPYETAESVAADIADDVASTNKRYDAAQEWAFTFVQEYADATDKQAGKFGDAMTHLIWTFRDDKDAEDLMSPNGTEDRIFGRIYAIGQGLDKVTKFAKMERDQVTHIVLTLMQQNFITQPTAQVILTKRIAR